MHLYEVLRRPVITEKNTNLQAAGKYVFEVADDATKFQIQQAVEKAFKVKVTAVNVINMPVKTRRIGRRQVQTQPWKKAIVTLRAGDKIQIVEGV
jgi:large subunit ribosomal protein L23